MQLYYPSNSLLHYMHGFTKLLIFGLLFTFAPLLMEKLSSLIILLLVCLALFIYIRPSKWHWCHLIPVFFLSVMMSVSCFFSGEGSHTFFQADLGYWEFTVSLANIVLAVDLICRMMIWCLLFFLILFTTSNEDITVGLKRFGLPEFITLSASLAMRYWGMMIDDVKMVMDAQYVRGVDFHSGSLYIRAKRFAGVFPPILFVFLKRFRTTSFALALKGVERKSRRTYYYNPKMTALDKWSVLCGCSAFAAFLIVRCFYAI